MPTMNVLDHPKVLQVLFHPRREGIRVLRPFDVRQIGVEVELGLTVGEVRPRHHPVHRGSSLGKNYAQQHLQANLFC